MEWIEVIGRLAAVGLLVLIPMELVEVRKNKKAILESNRKRIEAIEQHQKALRAYGDYFKEFQEWYEGKRKEGGVTHGN